MKSQKNKKKQENQESKNLTKHKESLQSPTKKNRKNIYVDFVYVLFSVPISGSLNGL